MVLRTPLPAARAPLARLTAHCASALQAANLLMNEAGDCKVADFGFARTFHAAGGKKEAMTAETGTFRWMAPEARFIASCKHLLQNTSSPARAPDALRAFPVAAHAMLLAVTLSAPCSLPLRPSFPPRPIFLQIGA